MFTERKKINIKCLKELVMRGLSLQNKPVEMGFKRYKNQLSYVDSVVAVIENT